MIDKSNFIQSFIENAVSHGLAIDQGDHKVADKFHKRLQSIYKKAKEDDLVDVFVDLLESSQDSVRLWAATFCLRLHPVRAVKALEDLQKSTNITGLTATTLLDLHKSESLNLL
ncbi:hypothetical protein ACWKW6_30120 [Dyadobacter jiangsuensis]